MKTIKEYFEEGARKAGNDSRLAEKLGVSDASTSRYRSGQRVPDPMIAAKLAIYLNVREFEVIAAAELARAKDKEEKRFWQDMGKRWATTAAVVLTINVAGSLDDGAATKTALLQSEAEFQRLYIMSNYWLIIWLALRRCNSRCNARIRGVLPFLDMRNSHSIVFVG